MPFKVPEYDSAFRSFFGEAVHELAAARSGLVSEMPIEESPGALGSVIQDREGNDVDLSSKAVQMEITLDANDVRDGDPEALLLLIDSVSEQLSGGLDRSMLGFLEKVTDATGNVVDAGGKKFSFELYMEMLEKVELGLTEDGELSIPTLVIHPNQAAKVEPLTPEQQERPQNFKEEKLEELLARRRSSRLS